MVDTLVSGASASRRVGSTPISGTLLRKNFRILPLFRLYLCIFISYEESYEDSISRCGYDGGYFL